MSAMPRSPTSRKSISLRGITFARIEIYCAARGITISGFVEQLANEQLDAHGQPMVDPKDVAFPRRKRNESPPPIGSGVHEF